MWEANLNVQAQPACQCDTVEGRNNRLWLTLCWALLKHSNIFGFYSWIHCSNSTSQASIKKLTNKKTNNADGKVLWTNFGALGLHWIILKITKTDVESLSDRWRARVDLSKTGHTTLQPWSHFQKQLGNTVKTWASDCLSLKTDNIPQSVGTCIYYITYCMSVYVS